jgi:hypothetical protein
MSPAPRTSRGDASPVGDAAGREGARAGVGNRYEEVTMKPEAVIDASPDLIRSGRPQGHYWRDRHRYARAPAPRRSGLDGEQAHVQAALRIGREQLSLQVILAKAEKSKGVNKEAYVAKHP